MVKLGFDVRGYHFEVGLKAIAQGFRASAAALNADVERIKAERTAYEESGVWEGEQDDDGHVIWSRGQILEMEQEAAEEALMHLRKAFVLALYHHWERAIRAYTGSHRKEEHKELVKRAEQKGITPVAELEKAYRLANTLKHNSEKYGPHLFEIWPAIFGEHFQSASGVDWYGSVVLSDEYVDEIVETIAKAGPKMWPHGKPF